MLGLPALEYRRDQADMIQVYKILHDIDNVDKKKLFRMSTYTATRGHSLKLFKKRSRLNIRANTFFKSCGRKLEFLVRGHSIRTLPKQL